jgi:hypothetical protein
MTAMQPSFSPHRRDDVRAFWTGPSLSLYEQLSLKSIVASGARMMLYSYDKDLVVPDGVELIDASEVLSGQVHEFRDASGSSSLALHSDLFRYLAIHKFGGWYIDLDIVLLGKTLPSDKCYIAYEQPHLINVAVMKFPAQSPIMAAAVNDARRRLPEAGLATTDAARLVIGPPLITRLIEEYALDHLARPQSCAYEIQPGEILAFFDPAQCESVLKRVAESDFTHLWNEIWRWLRIPKSFGPPAGSYLDVLFRRFGIEVSAHARLSFEALETWVHEYRALARIRQQISIDRIDDNSLDRFAQSVQTQGWRPISRPILPAGAAEPGSCHPAAVKPQTVRTFWQGDVFGLYQLANLRSFADRGHRVEVFSYNSDLRVPDWITVRDAANILPAAQVLRPLPNSERFAIDANLFRYALLNAMGGWWIDPDVVLLHRELPDAEIFLAGPDAFGMVPTGALKFPRGHPLLVDAIRETQLLGDTLEAWDRAGAELLTALADKHGLGHFRSQDPLGPISWFDVADLFSPAHADDLIQKCLNFDFLHLHDDVWRRAGIPHDLGPPENSLLDRILTAHETGMRFGARMSQGDLNRWLAHMYQCVRQRSAEPSSAFSQESSP